jgi:hypothetical protein
MKLVTLAVAASSVAHAATVNWGPARFLLGTSGGGTQTGTGGGILLNGGSGLKLYGSTSQTFDPNDPNFVAGSSEGPQIIWASFNGGPSGSFTTPTVPIAYDFSLSDSPAPLHAAQAINWILNLQIVSVGGGFGLTNITGTTGVGGGDVSGVGVINVPVGGSLVAWQIALEADVLSVAGETVTITVPQNSIDINAAPEPGTMGLAGGAIGLWMLRRRVRGAR